MNTRKFILAAATAGLALLTAGCDGDDDPAAPLTLKQFAVRDISGRSTDVAVPVEINGLPIDASSEDPAQFDDLLQS